MALLKAFLRDTRGGSEALSFAIAGAACVALIAGTVLMVDDWLEGEKAEFRVLIAEGQATARRLEDARVSTGLSQ